MMRWRWVVLIGLQLLLPQGGDGQDPTCDCNGSPGPPIVAPTCTKADADAAKPCGLWCDEEEKTAVFEPTKPGDVAGTGSISCQASTTTTTTSTASTTTTETDSNETTTTVKGGVVDNGNETEFITPDRCETGILSGTKLLIAKIFSYLSFVWILIWVLATIVANFKHKNSGHHRWLHMFQEFFILLLWLFMGIFNLTFKTNDTVCKATAIVIHICVVIVSAALVFEAIFADSMVHNKAFINGRLPPFLNYILPVIIGLIPALVTYFVKKDYYITRLHCFAEVPFDVFWGFVVPVWILLYVAGLKSSLGNLACDLTDEDVQDEDQIFWAKKSCKSLFFFAFNLLTCYLLCLFASSQQRFIIFIFFFLNTLLFGPIIFITHTYCHRNSQRKLYGKGMIGGFYKPCPPKHECPTLKPHPAPVVAPPTKKKDKNTQTEGELAPNPEEGKPVPPPKTDNPPVPSDARPITAQAPPRAATPAPPGAIPRRPSSAGNLPNWPNSREFYGWVGGKNKYGSSQDALFMPKPS